jgi:hypothetical protein
MADELKATPTPGNQAAADAATKAQTGRDDAAERAYRARLDEEGAKAAVVQKAAASGEVLITDFAGAPGSIFAVYGVNFDKAGSEQLKIGGKVPNIKVRRNTLIKGLLDTPGMEDLKAGPVDVTLGKATFKGHLG